MMDILKPQDVEDLIETTDKWCVSIYMPTHMTGREQQQDPIRLKNFLSQAHDQLVAHKVRHPDAQALLQPAENLLNDSYFWQHQSHGLAIFLSSDGVKIYRLPIEFEPLLVISHHFHIKPLLPLLSQNGQFYILALGLNQLRLLLATRDTVEEMELVDVPTNMEETVVGDAEESPVDFHVSYHNPHNSGSSTLIFHGQGNQSQEEKNPKVLRYFHLVDRGLNTLLEGEIKPMITVGLDYLLPIYQEANTYPYMLKEGVSGNAEGVKISELHQRAWEKLAPIFAEDKKEHRQRFLELAGMQSDLAATDLTAVVKAAHTGQVDTLYVPLNKEVWGKYDPQTHKVELGEEQTPGNKDLLDDAAVQTLSKGGTVYALPAAEIPGGGDLAAILRYTG